uniref:Major facilitator superfamily domain containing 11 n=1 Tax=Gouania willdenowi TaxID=441366 RepID=A0A8C5GHK1_GOUWI
MTPEQKKLFNIIVLGLGFMFMFTAFQTCGNIEQTVIKSFNSTEFNGSGYTSMSIIYGVFSASNLVAPSVVAVIGPQFSMFFSGLLYSAYIAMFIHPYTWSFYTASVLVGVGAAVLWTAQGNVLAINSDNHTIGRNSGIFWALLQFSLFFGNLYIYCAWHGHEHITDKDRQTVFISLTVISLVGCFLFFLIRKPDPDMSSSEVTESLIHACKVSVTKEMLLLSFSIGYTGLELTFYSGVYGTCIGAMTRFGEDAKSLIGISGICIGIGEILGGGIFGLLNKNNRFGRNPVVLLGLVTHFVAFYLVFLNIAKEGNRLLLCFTLELVNIHADVINNTDLFPVQSIMAALAFFYSNFLLLHWQLLILIISGILGTLTFFLAEWKAQSLRETDYSSI